MTTKKADKETKILQAAELIFNQQGFSNANMDLIAKNAGVSKGTVYFYYDSKENLYMAIAYKALNILNDQIHRAVHRSRDLNGCASVLAIMESYLDFSLAYPFYAEVMLDYIALVRSTNQGQDVAKTPRGMRDSLYFRKLHDIHNVPVILVVAEIQRGRADGSILNKEKAEKLYLTAWAITLGYMKIANTSLPQRDTILTIPIVEWKTAIITNIEQILKSKT
jgi:AcrR family transcriptional regulator